MYKSIAAVTVMALLLQAHSTLPAAAIDLNQGLSATNVGEVSGAIVGGVGGNYLAKKGKLGKTGQLAATIGGTIAGGMIGGTFGKQLDASSRARAEQAQMTAVSTGRRQTWQSPSHATGTTDTWSSNVRKPYRLTNNGGYPSGQYPKPAATGTIEPGHPYQSASGICRDYTHSIMIEGRRETSRGIACRNTDGTWRYAG